MTNKVIVQKTLDDITVKCEASSEHGDVPMEKLLAITGSAVTSHDSELCCYVALDTILGSKPW